MTIHFFTADSRIAFNIVLVARSLMSVTILLRSTGSGLRRLLLFISQGVRMPDEYPTLYVCPIASNNTNRHANIQKIFLLFQSSSPWNHTKPSPPRLGTFDPLRPDKRYARRLSPEMWSKIDMSITTSSIVRSLSSQVAVEITRCGVLESCDSSAQPLYSASTF